MIMLITFFLFILMPVFRQSLLLALCVGEEVEWSSIDRKAIAPPPPWQASHRDSCYGCYIRTCNNFHSVFKRCCESPRNCALIPVHISAFLHFSWIKVFIFHPISKTHPWPRKDEERKALRASLPWTSSGRGGGDSLILDAGNLTSMCLSVVPFSSTWRGECELWGAEKSGKEPPRKGSLLENKRQW